MLKFIRLNKKFSDQKNRKINKQLYVFFACLLIAIAFWLLISLSKIYSSTIKLPINYLNFPKNKVIVNKLPQFLHIDVNASGFDLVAYHLKLKKIPIVIDILRYISVDSRAIQRKETYIPTKYLFSDVIRHLEPDIQLLSIAPDTIYFNFNERTTKKVPIKANVVLSFEKQFELSDKINIYPDTIEISGPSSLIKKINYIESEQIKLSDLNDSTEITINLLKPNANIYVSENKVKVIIPVEKFTEGSIEVPIEVINTDMKYSVKIIPDKITATYMVSLSNYKKIKPDMFQVQVDLAAINKQPGEKLTINLAKQPPFIKTIKINPTKVEYIIRK